MRNMSVIHQVRYFIQTRSFFSVIICLLAILTSAQSNAATIVEGGDEAMGCTLTLQGVIEAGDAEKLKEVIHNTAGFPVDYERFMGMENVPKPGILCLESVGGSLDEALKIATFMSSDEMYVPTAIARNKNCHSACSIIFMAGSIGTRAGRVPDRTMDATSSLGFHSPSLEISAGNYSETAVSKAFSLSKKSIARLFELTELIQFPNSLMKVWLDTPSNELFVVKTIGEVAAWNISLVGFRLPPKLRKDHFYQFCENTRLHREPFMGFEGLSFATEIGNENTIQYDIADLISATSENTSDPDWDSIASDQEFQVTLTDGVVDFNIREDTSFGDQECSGDYHIADKSGVYSVTPSRWNIEYSVDPALFYHPETEFLYLSDSISKEPMDAEISVGGGATEVLDGRCFVFRDTNSLAEAVTLQVKEACQIEISISNMADNDKDLNLRFKSPSGRIAHSISLKDEVLKFDEMESIGLPFLDYPDGFEPGSLTGEACVAENNGSMVFCFGVNSEE